MSARFGGGLRCEQLDRGMIRSIGVIGRGTSIGFQPVGCLRVTLISGESYDVLADQAVSELK